MRKLSVGLGVCGVELSSLYIKLALSYLFNLMTLYVIDCRNQLIYLKLNTSVFDLKSEVMFEQYVVPYF